MDLIHFLQVKQLHLLRVRISLYLVRLLTKSLLIGTKDVEAVKGSKELFKKSDHNFVNLVS